LSWIIVENELFWLNCNGVAMSCTIYMVSYNFVIHAICLLTLTMYKYNELQVSFVIQKLSCKASCKTPFFSHSDFEQVIAIGYTQLILQNLYLGVLCISWRN